MKKFVIYLMVLLFFIFLGSISLILLSKADVINQTLYKELLSRRSIGVFIFLLSGDLLFVAAAVLDKNY